MRRKCRSWALLSLLFAAGVISWLGYYRFEDKDSAPPRKAPASPPGLLAVAASPALSFHKLLGSGSLRLTNTSLSPGRLLGKPTAILLENALFDTTLPVTLPGPALRAQGDPGAYIVQSRRAPDGAFRALLSRSGSSIVAYIPNRAYLVLASEGVAGRLQASPLVQSVLPYQPYYKLKSDLLQLAVEGRPLPAGSGLRILLFTEPQAAARADLERLGATRIAEDGSPFGPVLDLRLPAAEGGGGEGLLAALARLPGVQEIELARPRLPANDQVRSATGAAPDAVSTNNYLGLTGSNVVVEINDTGVDGAHPDLIGRVTGDSPKSLRDITGHGTHVAATIAGSGLDSTSLTNAADSRMPGAPGQFRGMAPAARLFATSGGADSYLQQSAASAHALISNNSWTYATGGYDLAAASYDAAVRDALPTVPGSQPVLFIFAAGNAGGGQDDGTGGEADSILSPATAKNVITVGALEQARHLANSVWGWVTNVTPQRLTNQPWLQLTASSNRVAGFSSRGNVGLGVEGDFGRFKPDLVAPGVFVVSARSQDWDEPGYYSNTNASLVFSNFGNTLVVLSNLNDHLAAPPWRYRYESGTSLAAGSVAGALALMQEFFQRRLGRTNSPALMKALLISGARPPFPGDDLCVTNPLNLHGWGALSLPSALPAALTNLAVPAAASPMVLFDQNPAGALATSESRTRYINLSAAATSLPLRMTLAWTDPPGNPVAGLKLVNDLDLLVTNLDTGEIYWGNDIPAGSVTNAVWDPATLPRPDQVNNVENISLRPSLSAHYSVTVAGRSVNVNAVSERTDEIVQDYALVIAIGDGTLADALTAADSPTQTGAAPPVTVLTNLLDPAGPDWGAILLGQRIGSANPLDATNAIPLFPAGGAITFGDTNQWRFYALTNSLGYANAAFLTFSARRLSLDGVDAADLTAAGANPSQADIDLYVSTDPGLLSLTPDALANADTSLGRGGTETIVYTNAVAGVYFIGVKCESRQGAEYGFAGILSQLPFSQVDSSGNEILRGFPAPAVLPPAANGQPGVGRLLALAMQSGPLHRAVVTNTLTHAALGDLVGTLSHLDASVVLNHRHAYPPVVATPFIYDDSDEADIPGAQPTDGPGSLDQFCGQESAGQWMLEETDPVAGAAGTDDNLAILLSPEPDMLAGFTAALLPGACRDDYLALPAATTNLGVAVSLLSGTGPLTVQVCAAGASDDSCQSCLVTANTSGWLLLDKTVTPPLNGGNYRVRLCNQGPDLVTVSNWAKFALDPSGPAITVYTSTSAVSIADAALTTAVLKVGDCRKIVTAQVGVRIDHPRVSDLALRLVSPSGTRVLLDENRGGQTAGGMGQNIITTNVTPVSSTAGPMDYTNILNTGQTSGSVTVFYDMYSIPDELLIFYEDSLIYDSGMVTYTNLARVSYGPGEDTNLTIVVINTNDAWDYTVTATQAGFLYTTFTENTNLTMTPIKFAIPPFTNATPAPGGGAANGIFYLPEESLAQLAGQSAQGSWKLEIEDTRAGPASGAATLLGWQLTFCLADTVPTPIPLTHHQPAISTVAAEGTQYYTVDVPVWAHFATNSLLRATSPLTVLFNPSRPPDADNGADDFVLLSHSIGGAVVLASGAPPALSPGARYYIAVQNTNSAPVTFAFEVDFDVVTLADGVPMSVSLGADSQPRYFAYDVSSNANLVVFQLLNLSANANLFAESGLPFPAPDGSADYSSTNPGTNDEQIDVFTNSVPGALPGRWYVGVFNADITNVTAAVLAREFAVYGTNTTLIGCQIFSNALSFTWSSSPGSYYHVLGATNLAGVNPAPVSRTLVASDYMTTFSVPLPSPYQTFAVLAGPAPGGDLTPPRIGPLTVTSTTVKMEWTAGTNSQFQVQWSPSISPAAWTTFPGVVTSSTGGFSFLDDGSQTGGLDGARFYRLLLIP